MSTSGQAPSTTKQNDSDEFKHTSREIAFGLIEANGYSDSEFSRTMADGWIADIETKEGAIEVIEVLFSEIRRFLSYVPMGYR